MNGQQTGPPDRPPRPLTLRLLLLVLVPLALLGMFDLGLRAVFHFNIAPLYRVKVGMTQEQVRHMLDEPDRVVTAGPSAPPDYHLSGWGYDGHPLRHELWLYFRLTAALYVYFDSSNRVEHVFIGYT